MQNFWIKKEQKKKKRIEITLLYCRPSYECSSYVKILEIVDNMLFQKFWSATGTCAISSLHH